MGFALRVATLEIHYVTEILNGEDIQRPSKEDCDKDLGLRRCFRGSRW